MQSKRGKFMKKNKVVLPSVADLHHHTEHSKMLTEQQSTDDGHTQLNELQDGHTQLNELQYSQIEPKLQNTLLTEPQHAREEARVELARYTDLYDFAPISYFTIGRDGIMQKINLTAATLLGVARSKLIGRRFSSFVCIEFQPAFKAFLAQVFSNKTKQTCKLALRRPGKLPFFVHIEANIEPSGQTCGVVVVDLSERQYEDEHIHFPAHHDILTDLPNKVLFKDRLQQALAKAKRDKEHIALIFINLDKFTSVNNTYGHKLGDLLLMEAAKRLQDCVRTSDTAARLGGDEFVVLLPYNEHEQDAMMVAHKILHVLKHPCKLAGHNLHISPSIGVAIYPEHGSDEEFLLKNAAIAMVHAKKNGGSYVTSYEELDGRSANLH
jgi:diguanylate cyclase (GGDEF)-like protein/PAS domain S-box-containing protein